MLRRGIIRGLPATAMVHGRWCSTNPSPMGPCTPPSSPPRLPKQKIETIGLNDPNLCLALRMQTRPVVISFANTRLRDGGLEPLTPAEEEAAVRACNSLEHFHSACGKVGPRAKGDRPVTGKLL